MSEQFNKTQQELKVKVTEKRKELAEKQEEIGIIWVYLQLKVSKI